MDIKNSIRRIKRKIKTLNLHIDNYYKKDCKTAVCMELVSERDALENVLKELETYKKIAEKLAEYGENCYYGSPLKISKEDLIEIARNEVEKDGN